MNSNVLVNRQVLSELVITKMRYDAICLGLLSTYFAETPNKDSAFDFYTYPLGEFDRHEINSIIDSYTVKSVEEE